MKRLDFIRGALLTLPFLSLSTKAQENSETVFHPSDIRNFSNDPLKAIKSTGEAYIPRGVHTFNSLTLFEGKIFGPGTIQKSKGSKEALRIIGNVHIEGITFNSTEDRRDGSCEIRLGDSLNFATIANCSFKGSCYAAISADSNGLNDQSLSYKKPASNIKVVFNNITGEYSRHLYLHSVEDLLIQGNSFSRSKRDSIRLRQACRRVQILANNFHNIGTLPVDKKPESADAVDTYWSGEEFIFCHNILRMISLHGLDIKGLSPKGTYGSQRFIISHNLIESCGWHGINITNAESTKATKDISLEQMIIDSNLVSKCNQLQRDEEAAAIMLSGPVSFVSVSSNNIFNNRGRGLMLNNRDQDRPINKNIRIQGNMVSQNKLGMAIFPCDGLILKDNISPVTSTQKVGLIVRESDRQFKMKNFESSGNLTS